MKGLPVTSTIPNTDHIVLPPKQGGMPVNVPVFSDNRRLIDPAIPGLVGITRAYVTATRSKGGMVHSGKLLFYHFQLVDYSIHAVPTPVPVYQTTANLEPPLVAGIPVFHQLPVESVFQDLRREVRSLRSRLSHLPGNPVLAMRSVYACDV